MAINKSINTLVLDAGPIIKNEPSVSTLLSQSERLVTTPAIISEIKDATTRNRVQTTLRPFLTLRTPNSSSVKFVTDFARRTGDLTVLSVPDIQLIALTYEIECERNGGDWRLRKLPGQKRINGAPPVQAEANEANTQTTEAPSTESAPGDQSVRTKTATDPTEHAALEWAVHDATTSNETGNIVSPQIPATSTLPPSDSAESHSENDIPAEISDLTLGQSDSPVQPEPFESAESNPPEGVSEDSSSESDSEGWITPSNLKKKQARDSGIAVDEKVEKAHMQVAVLTTDFAMQNVILQINLNLLSPSLDRVSQLKGYVLRCHGCFHVTKDMTKEFCPRCGQHTLTRVSCSINANKEFKLHLKKNMQWHVKGNRYSIPKPVHGAAHGRVQGGGKGGWGNDLILVEDQKEYQRAAVEAKRRKERSLMDEDYLPGILTGDRTRSGGRIKVGAGRNVNSKKR